jgi:hypothetical protein
MGNSEAPQRKNVSVVIFGDESDLDRPLAAFASQKQRRSSIFLVFIEM